MEAKLQENLDPVELLRQLAKARFDLNEVNSGIKILEESFRAEHAGAFEAQAECRAAVVALEDEVRNLGMKAYAQDPENKSPLPGVGIRVRTTFAYTPEQAFEWCKAHDMFITYDEGKFDGLCKTEARPEFVQVIETPSATIATDIDAALTKAGL